MPLVKRNTEPRHLCHGPVPDGIGNELECVTNNTLSSIIRQLSSLRKTVLFCMFVVRVLLSWLKEKWSDGPEMERHSSVSETLIVGDVVSSSHRDTGPTRAWNLIGQHAENVFGELFNEANTFYGRANSLQDRIDRLAIKVTQLDSSVEEVSLQDINMRKAFKSSTVHDQQVLSKDSASNSVAELYNSCDRPPPLNTLTEYRQDSTDAMTFYSDPSYFFEMWKEKMLQDTEDKRKERRRQREQKRSMESSTIKHDVKKVRKARNRRQEWNMMALDKELRPDHRHPQSLHRGASSEGSLSPDGRPDLPDYPVPPLPTHATCNHAKSRDHVSGKAHPSPPVEHEYHSIDVNYKRVTCTTSLLQGADPTMHPPADYNSSPPPPPTPGPPIPPPQSTQTAFGFHLGALPPMPHNGDLHSGPRHPLPPVPPPPGPPPPPLPLPMAPPHVAGHNSSRAEAKFAGDPKSDLLSAIRIGIQLKKVQEQQEQQNKRELEGCDVATILSRRIAVEYSDSEDDSEAEDNDWSD